MTEYRKTTLEQPIFEGSRNTLGNAANIMLREADRLEKIHGFVRQAQLLRIEAANVFNRVAYLQELDDWFKEEFEKRPLSLVDKGG